MLFHATNAEDVAQCLKDADTLLQFLLKREEEDWPYDLLDGLLETGQLPLATILLEEIQKLDQDGRFFAQPQIQHVRRRLAAAVTTRDEEMKLDDPSMMTFPTGNDATENQSC